jgi:hypothetical protein
LFALERSADYDVLNFIGAIHEFGNADSVELLDEAGERTDAIRAEHLDVIVDPIEGDLGCELFCVRC